MPGKYFHVEGVATRVHHAGATTLPGAVPDLSRGEVVLCLHGGGGHGGTFAGLLEALAARHSPLAFDQPGHARSGGLDSLGTIERMADFSRALALKLGLRPHVLLGNSMGGAIAMQYALDHPDAVRALVLAGSGARFPIPDAYLAQLRRVVEGKERRRLDRRAFSPATPGEIVRRGIMEDLKTDPRVVYGDVLAARAWDVEARLGDIRQPTLVLVGEDEMDALREQSDLLAERIPNARLVVIEKAGHLAHFERPEAVGEAVEAFLAELAA
jgi:pimeloyl-ACP methyl ester carboxylesterase